MLFHENLIFILKGLVRILSITMQRIYQIITVGVKGISDSGPLHIKPMAHAEEEEMSEVEHRKSKLLGYTVENNPVLSEL